MANITIRTPEKAEIVLDALRTKPTYTFAARKARIGRPTLIQWRKDDPAFEERVQAARLDGMVAVVDKLIERGLDDDDTTALIFLAKSYFRETFGDKVDHVHRGLITFAPDWIAVREAIYDALTPYPDALGAVMARVSALGAGDG